MLKKWAKPYKICGAFDTETTNILSTDAEGNPAWRAFVVCYQVNDLRNVDLAAYECEVADDIRVYREDAGILAWIQDLIEWGLIHAVVPVVCGYNLMFDLQTLIYSLAQKYAMKVSAQTSTNVYTLDLRQDKNTVLRFWDTFHLEQNGLAAMGETAGLAKLKGDWDYSLVRTPETPLTDAEISYARRDVQVIPAYLRYILTANEWATPDMLGVKIITKTSLVRRMAENEVGGLRWRKGKANLEQTFIHDCKAELPHTFYTYGLRKACFRGGFTFTSAAYASTIVENVCSLDVTSMHHQFTECEPRVFGCVTPSRHAGSLLRESLPFAFPKRTLRFGRIPELCGRNQSDSPTLETRAFAYAYVLEYYAHMKGVLEWLVIAFQHLFKSGR